MRVLTKTSYYYLLLSAVVFLLGGINFYWIMQQEIYDEVDDQLFTDKENILAFIRQNNRLPSVTSGISEAILVKEANPASPTLEKLADTLIYSSYDEEYVYFRRLTFTAYQDGRPYEYTILKSLTDFEDLFESTMLAMGVIFVLLLVGLVFINYYINKFIWRHFYDTLSKIKRYSLAKDPPLQLTPTSTREFQELNAVLEAMTHKMHRDYLNLKEFTENASHEIQTPLAIVNNKLELIMQSDALSQQQAQLLQELYAPINRLGRLNKTLILLTRIENQEFSEQEELPLHSLVKEQLEQLQEMIGMRELVVEPPLLEPVYRRMNRGLAEILISNLLVNAIRHNHTGGSISISLTPRQLCIKNTGEAYAGATTEQYFTRFTSGHQAPESLGIGLALVKKICEHYALVPSYTYSEGQHILCIYFPPTAG
ncbi:sensor histidine kinase [Cesiribacter andamanensis]|uniref:histidine kinase n=1 Tax=Cesiribacter andamanensis AMV16 TaxID=1279009 RepID=M7N7T7_9BACT|nr:HAMP domain-containing sensor histidine kinase [Cesiribacter andamanensis]EMR03307.1 putative sensor-like histidine kinase YedV [Cesiribacter andamanensis AMV16]